MRALLIVGIALLLAGCSLGGDEGGGDGSVEAGELAKLVLQPDDVPRVFLRFDEGRQGIADTPEGSRADRSRFGRQGGWKARYRRPGTAETQGPLVIASLADVFESDGGAKDDFEALGTNLEEAQLGWVANEAPELGDEALAMSLAQGSGPTRIAYFVVAWREANVVASVEVNGFAGKTDLGDALELAQKQARRVSRAAQS